MIFIASLLGGGFGGATETGDVGIGMFFGVGYLFFSLLSALVSLLIQAAVVRGALKITEGQKIELSTFLSTETSVKWCWHRSCWPSAPLSA